MLRMGLLGRKGAHLAAFGVAKRDAALRMSGRKVGVLPDMLQPLLIRYRFSRRDPGSRAAQSPSEAKAHPLFLPGGGRPDLSQLF